MNLTLRQLRAFVAVAEVGSFTLAAQRVNLTQAAVSVLVRETERELGTRLFDRHTRSVQLTDAGRQFLPHVLRMLQDLGEGVATVRSLRDKRRGLVRVAAPQLMACTLMPRVIAGYRRLYPDIDVRLTDTLPEQMLDLLHTGEVEVAIGPDDFAAQGVSSRPLLRDRHLLACPGEHRLARKRSARWDDLRGEPFIAPTRDFMSRLRLEMRAGAQALPIEPVHEVSYITTALGMVASGLGLTACPSFAAPLAAAHGLVMRPLVAPEFFRHVDAFTLAKRSLSPAAESFIAFVAEFAAGDARR